MVFATEALLSEHGKSIKDLTFAIQVGYYELHVLTFYHYIVCVLTTFLVFELFRDLETWDLGLQSLFTREAVR